MSSLGAIRLLLHNDLAELDRLALARADEVIE